MLDDILDFSPRGWGRVILWTVVGTIACVAIALYVDSFNFHTMTGDELTRAILVDVFLPICLAVPMLLFLLIKLRQLAIAHHQLAQVASTDSLTSVLNRGAFTAMVEGYLKQVREDDFAHRGGALLVIDADNFKTVNDTFGHDAGDEALKLIAKAIARLLRTTDLVGRIGGEEFAVFLPGSGTLQAEVVAERIRHAVTEADFVANGQRRELSVSVGGAVFDRRIPFGDLFRLADQQLYTAKQNGRNRVSVAPIVHYDTVPMASAG
jgi:diguanylate cyclase (GGDEF)-like protein